MGKSWKQILEDVGRIPPEQSMKDTQEMLEERGLTWAEFTETRGGACWQITLI